MIIKGNRGSSACAPSCKESSKTVMNTRFYDTLRRYSSIFRGGILKKVIVSVVVHFISLRQDYLINGALYKSNKVKGVRHKFPVKGWSAKPGASALD